MIKNSTLKKALFILGFGFTTAFTSNAQLLNESFDDITTLVGNNWSLQNLSDPIGIEDWVQGYSPNANQLYYFIANSGHDSSYICASFQNGSGTSTLSNWLITPPITMNNNDTLSFFSRSTDLNGTVYPDNLQVWLNQTNTTDVGSTATSTGDFTDLLLEINPNLDQTSYPFVWTKYDIVISGLPTGGVTGRIGFRYFVTDGGPAGANSFIIGIDDAIYTSGTTGISDNNAKLNVTVGPNPATDYVKVNFNEPTKTNLSVKITNSLGQLVAEKSIQAGSIESKIDVAGLAKGTYTLLLRGVDSYTKRSFVKN